MDIRCVRDDRGELYVAEYSKEIPFLVRRVYYICNVKDEKVSRGFHAHKALQQVLICLGGSCEIMLDNGLERQTVLLDEPGKAIYLKPGLWREMRKFSSNATLMVFASQEYDEGDYIRDYDSFKRYKGVI